MLYGLGYLSKAYKKALWEPFSLVGRSVSTALGLALQTQSFDYLSDTDEHTVSRQRLIELLTKAFSSDPEGPLDLNEVPAFASFLMERLNVRAGVKENADADMSLNEMLLSLSDHDPLDFRTIAGLFDPDRKTHLMERFFMPQELSESLHLAFKFKQSSAAASLKAPVRVDAPEREGGKAMSDENVLPRSLASSAPQQALWEEVRRLRLEVEQLKQCLAELRGSELPPNVFQPRPEGSAAVDARVLQAPGIYSDVSALQEVLLFVLNDLATSRVQTLGHQAGHPLSSKQKEAFGKIGAASLVEVLESFPPKTRTLQVKWPEAQISSFDLATSLCARLDGLEVQQTAQQVSLQSMDARQAAMSHSIMQVSVVATELARHVECMDLRVRQPLSSSMSAAAWLPVLGAEGDSAVGLPAPGDNSGGTKILQV
eukprot:TRINITY_DN17190_c0_g1_i3.p1 TRINITY_DN17190_c0_g1~~TRINITY_DN17190_c0_g1_i3.p1  ORF type:complete len:428 (-),score=84.92 TRINITY_DN17190_c0_g1_i3:138-1421(-)